MQFVYSNCHGDSPCFIYQKKRRLQQNIFLLKCITNLCSMTHNNIKINVHEHEKQNNNLMKCRETGQFYILPLKV